MKKYKLTIEKAFTGEPFNWFIEAASKEEAIDKLVDQLVDDESEDVCDYYDIKDNVEVDEVFDEVIAENQLVCGGETGGYIKLLNIEEIQ